MGGIRPASGYLRWQIMQKFHVKHRHSSFHSAILTALLDFLLLKAVFSVIVKNCPNQPYSTVNSVGQSPFSFPATHNGTFSQCSFVARTTSTDRPAGTTTTRLPSESTMPYVRLTMRLAVRSAPIFIVEILCFPFSSVFLALSSFKFPTIN